MRILLPIPVLFSFAIIFSCNENVKPDLQSLKNEIIETEKAFAQMAKDKGVSPAFTYFAADDGVLMRNNQIIEGKAEMEAYFAKQTLEDVKLEWEPDFVDVSESGDLAYTYGKYTFSARDTSGQLIESKGIFHTVWKKQPNGEWRFVWD